MKRQRRTDGIDPVLRGRARRRALQAIYAWQVAGGDAKQVIAQFAHEQAREIADLEYFEDLVRGDTRHYEQVADDCADGLMRVALDHGVPVANGVLAVELHEDAEKRAGGSHGNKGEEAALVAIEMANLLEQLP